MDIFEQVADLIFYDLRKFKFYEFSMETFTTISFLNLWNSEWAVDLVFYKEKPRSGKLSSLPGYDFENYFFGIQSEPQDTVSSLFSNSCDEYFFVNKEGFTDADLEFIAKRVVKLFLNKIPTS